MLDYSEEAVDVFSLKSVKAYREQSIRLWVYIAVSRTDTAKDRRVIFHVFVLSGRVMCWKLFWLIL